MSNRGRPRPGTASRAPLDKVRAPYGFVPLNPRVVLPAWGDAASRDLPFEDGICGTLTLEVEARSPIFVRGTNADDSQPFQLPDKTWALPGTTLRGMLRNVVEIATLGKLSRVNDHRFPLRDLHNRESYLQYMARIVERQPVPLVNAGWLIPTNPEGTEAAIVPCHFAKLEYAKLQGFAKEWGVPNFDPGRQQTSVDKYQRLLGKGCPHDKRLPSVRVAIQRIPRAIDGLVSHYGKVEGPGTRVGNVVMTGQPSPYRPDRVRRRGGGHPKHHDFVFHDAMPAAKIGVDASALRDFEFAHSDRGQQNSLAGAASPNEEWAYWRSKVFPAGDGDRVDPAVFEERPELGVPVFFLTHEDGTLRAMGLAMMFRLAAEHSVHEAIARVQPEVRSPEPDFAEVLFGRVPGESESDRFALGGRVSFGVARATSPVHPEPRVGPLVLGTPKASYYPNYLEQGRAPGQPPPLGRKGEPRYTTWMEDHAIPRGWKRYRPIEGGETITPPIPKKGDGTEVDLENTGTSFCPLPAGTVFRAAVRVHNVRPEELGALCWAIDFGGAEDTFHKLGMARPLGYGTVTLRIVGEALDRNDGEAVERASCVGAFRSYMNDQWRRLGGAGTWDESRTIQELIALARPQPKEDARHMRLDPGERINEFVDAKKAGLVLVAATDDGERINWPDPMTKRVAAWAGAGGPSRGPSAPATPTRPRRVEGLPSPGDRIVVVLSGQNKKGRWKARWSEGEGQGTLIGGTAPDDIEVGQEHTVKVKRASSRLAMELEWD